MNMSDIENANKERLLNIMKQIPSGVPYRWEKINFSVGGLMYKLPNRRKNIL